MNRDRYQYDDTAMNCMPVSGQQKASLHKVRITGLKYLYLLILILSFVASGCGHTKELLYYTAPVPLPGIADEMNTPGFWIGMHPSPDKEILSGEEIGSFNSYIEDDLKLTHRVVNISRVYSGEKLREETKSTISDFYSQVLYRDSGRKTDYGFYQDIEKVIGLSDIPEDIMVGYGFIGHNTNERVIPTEDGLYAQQGDLGFDEVQNSGLDIGAAIATLYNSADGQWTYVISDSNEGWVRRNMIVPSSIDGIRGYENGLKIIIIARSADIFLNEGLTEYYDHGRMGTRLAFSGRETADAYEVNLPSGENDTGYIHGYVRKRDAVKGCLPYTPRTIIDQAFKVLSAPYGWGDRGGEQDCSRFIQEIFATVGIILPRNSGPQGRVGRIIGEYEAGGKTDKKILALQKEGIGGVTILQLKGHIMLYLGEKDGIPYVIHSAWGYREPGLMKDRVRVIGRVAVTDTSLGAGSRRGSLLERVIQIRNIEKGR